MPWIEFIHWTVHPLIFGAGILTTVLVRLIFNKYFQKDPVLSSIKTSPPGNGNLTRIRILNTELTEKERMLIQANAKFLALINHAPIFVASFDKQGLPDLWNAECEKVFGYTKEEIIGKEDIMRLFYPDEKDYKEVMQSLRKSSGKFQEFSPKIRKGRKIKTSWANVILPDGSLISIGYKLQKVTKIRTLRTKK